MFSKKKNEIFLFFLSSITLNYLVILILTNISIVHNTVYTRVFLDFLKKSELHISCLLVYKS